MKSIKSSIRGDSGLTDSQLIRTQELLQQKNQEAIEELEQYSKMEMRRRRYQAAAKPPKARTSLWSWIKSWFTYTGD